MSLPSVGAGVRVFPQVAVPWQSGPLRSPWARSLPRRLTETGRTCSPLSTGSNPVGTAADLHVVQRTDLLHHNRSTEVVPEPILVDKATRPQETGHQAGGRSVGSAGRDEQGLIVGGEHGLLAIVPTPQPSRAAAGQWVPEPQARPRRRQCRAPAGRHALVVLSRAPSSPRHRGLNRRSARRARPSPVTGPGLAIREQGPPRAACHSARPGMARPRGALPPASCPAAWPPLSCGRCRPGSAIRPDAALGT